MDGDRVALRGGGERARCVGEGGISSTMDSGRGGYWVRLVTVFWVPRDFIDWGWDAWDLGDQGRSAGGAPLPPLVRVGERAREAAFGDIT